MPLSRSVTKATALSIARLRVRFGMTGSSARSTMSMARKPRNHDHFWCGALCGGPTVFGSWWNSSSIVTPRGLIALGLSACSTSSGTITVRAQYEILSRWNGNQLRQQHDLDRHHRHAVPRDHAIEREQRAREHVATSPRRRATGSLRARAACDRRIDVVADHLEREVGLHARAHVERRPRGTAASRHARPGCGADRRRSCAPARGSASRRSSAPSARIRPGSSRRLRARRPSARPAAARRGARRSRRGCAAPAHRACCSAAAWRKSSVVSLIVSILVA